ncbi:MAG: nitronate monooxygenase [Sphingobacterium sp.]|jgi:nitronate monooxygenase|nr:nitronate monooxygenase [Sphingobacterium sp.]
MHWDKEFTHLLGIQYPLIQAPMFGVSTVDMAVAATQAGCLGSLALADIDADAAVQVIRATKKLTDKPFAVNLFVHRIPEVTPELVKKYGEVKAFLETFAAQHSIDVVIPELSAFKINEYHSLVDVIIEENCKIVSFTFGNLDETSIARLKAVGCILIGTCTSVQEAMILEKSGIDLICVQGIEAGGHRGSFVDEEIPQIGGFSLLSQVYDTVDVPLIYAGGISNGRTVLAAQVLGAKGFQIGSLLCASAESSLKYFEKQRLISAREEDVILTKSFSGRYARGIKNTFTEAIDDSGYILPYPYQNKITGVLRAVAKRNENVNFLNLWTGQSLPQFSERSTADILKQLLADVEHYRKYSI